VFRFLSQKKQTADAAKALKKQLVIDARNSTLHTIADQIECPHCGAMYWKEEAPSKVTPCCKGGAMIIASTDFPPIPSALLTNDICLNQTFISNVRLLNQCLCFSAIGTTPIASKGGLGFHGYTGPHCIRCNGIVRPLECTC
jgi:hypothetical protein